MLKDDNVYLAHMLDMTRGIVVRLKEVDKDKFDQNEELRFALVHMLQIIGEAARNISIEMRRKHNNIPWEEIIGMRHRIVHDYINIKYEIVWQVIVQDIPKLALELEKIVPPDNS